MKLSQKDIARLFGVSVQTVQAWQRDPAFPASEKSGRLRLYPAPDIVKWWLSQKIDEMVGEADDGESLDLNQERAKLARAQTQRQEQLLQRERNEVVDIAEVAESCKVAGQVLQRELKSRNRRLAGRLMKMKAVRSIVKLLDNSDFDVLNVYCDKLKKSTEKAEQGKS